MLFYVLSATKIVAEGPLTYLKDLYKVTSFSKCMGLRALDLEKGMSGPESPKENPRLFDPCSAHSTWLRVFFLAMNTCVSRKHPVFSEKRFRTS